MFGWSISASACRSCSKRWSTARESMPGLMSFSATLRFTGSVCFATHTSPMPPSPIRSCSVYRPAMSGIGVELAAVLGGGRAAGRRGDRVGIDVALGVVTGGDRMGIARLAQMLRRPVQEPF